MSWHSVLQFGSSMLSLNELRPKNIFKTIHRSGRVCLHCGGFFVQASLFCKPCESTLWDRHGQGHQGLIDDIPIFSLFQWEPDEDRQVSKLLMDLKKGKLTGAFGYYAQEFLLRQNLEIHPDSLLLACPGKRPDHASVLSQKFSELLSLPWADGLEKTESEADPKGQKSKSLKDRQRLRFSCHKTWTQKHVIFIDDIVTSGATVRAAKRAIGPCQSFQVWALAQRVVSLRPLC